MRLLFLLICWWQFSCENYQDALRNLRHSVFKIRTESQDPDFLVPWQKRPTQRSSGTGFYIGEQRIMTNAHVVANAKFITVQRDGDAQKVNAQVEFIAHDCDLAILKVEDKRILATTKPMKFGGLPRLQTPVSTIGYPTGGDQVSITQGVVSRIDYRRYAHSGYLEHLLIQVDSAINPGNSGGPVVQGDAVVGVAFQAYTAAENTGYIIPSAVVNRFLKDIADGSYEGHPTNEVVSFADLLANPSMRAYYGLDEERGVLVTHVPAFSPFHGVVQENDIILEVEKNPVGSDGKILFQGERVNFEVVYDLKQIGESMELTVLRDSKPVALQVKAAKREDFYFAGDVYTPFPRFYTHAGFIFTALSRNLLMSWGNRWYQQSPVVLRYFHYMANLDPEFAGHSEYIVYIKKLNAPINQYILTNNYQVVRSVNGVKPRDLQHFHDLIEQNKDKYIAIDFYFDDNTIVLPGNTLALNDKINQHYGVEPKQWLGSYNRDTTTEWKQSEKQMH